MNFTDLPNEILEHIIGGGFIVLDTIETENLLNTFKNNKKLYDVVIYCLKRQIRQSFTAPKVFPLIEIMSEYELNKINWLICSYDYLEEIYASEDMLRALMCIEIKNNRTNIIEFLYYNGAPISELCMNMYSWRNDKHYITYETINGPFGSFTYDDVYESEYVNQSLLVDIIMETAEINEYYHDAEHIENNTPRKHMLTLLLVGSITGIWFDHINYTYIQCLNYNPELLEFLVPDYIPIDYKIGGVGILETFFRELNPYQVDMDTWEISPNELDKIARILKYLKSQGVDDSFIQTYVTDQDTGVDLLTKNQAIEFYNKMIL